MGERTSLVVAGVALGASLVAVRSRTLLRWDRRAGSALSRPLGHVGDVAFGVGTDLGSVYAIAGATTALLAARRPHVAADVAGAGALAWVAAQAAKPLVDRPRPYEAHGAVRLVAKPSGSSWPSGHVAVAAAMAGALSPSLPPAGRRMAGTVTGFVAMSRVYVGVHYLTDVVAGYGVGVLSAKVMRRIRGRWRP